MSLKKRISRSLVCCALALLPMLVLGQSADHVRVSLVSEVLQVAPGQSFDVIFHQQIDEGWHTYWTSPGDSGAPPSIRWEAPEGVTVGEFRYPWPERIAYGPLMNYGYHDEVLLPFQVTVDASFKADQLRIRGSGRVLVCEEICIPQTVKVELTLAVGQTLQNDAAGEMFSRARSRLPVSLAIASTFEISGESGSEMIELKLALPFELGMANETRLSRVEYFPHQPDVLDNPAEQLFEVDREGLILFLRPGYDFDPLDADLSGVLVLHEDVGEGVSSAFEITVGGARDAASNMAAASSKVTGSSEMGLLTALLLAFLGGLILNLMPCVFPVLSIKILSLVESVHEQGESIRLHGLAYTGGVVGSFVAIAGVLLVLRATGEVIGWGFQLQSPIVVSLLAYLFVLIGLNLLGVFEIGLSLMSLGSGSDGGSHSPTQKKGYLGSVSTGVLATIVAAPCTAPFMGAAVGYALLQSPAMGLLVFAALGAGMALPYLLLCYSPALLGRLPRPGNWMVTLRQFLAFPMFASAIWLLWVLGIQAGPTAMMQVLVGALLIAFAVWLASTTSKKPALKVTLSVISAALVLLAVYVAVIQKAVISAPIVHDSEGQVIKELAVMGDPLVYSKAALESARATGPVFVNFTAAWCITCKVNEINALNTDSVKSSFERNNITYLRADWTNEDPLITLALQEFGRSGVPLYLLYPQGTSAPEVLPQLLTQALVIEAVESLN